MTANMSSLKSKKNYLVWGKSGVDAQTQAVHLAHLQDHLMAVVATVQALFELPRFAQVARRLLKIEGDSQHPRTGSAPLSAPEAYPYLWAAAVHDLGKLAFPFQAKRGAAWLPLVGIPAGEKAWPNLERSLSDDGAEGLAFAWREWDKGFVPTLPMGFNSYVKEVQAHRPFFAHGEMGDRVPWELVSRLKILLADHRVDETITPSEWLWRHLARAGFAHHGARLSEASDLASVATSQPNNALIWGPAGGSMANFWLPKMEVIATLGSPNPSWDGLKDPLQWLSYSAPEGLPALTHWVAGLVTVADWLGSGLARPGNGPDLVALPPAESDAPSLAFAHIEAQHARWVWATEGGHPEQTQARTELLAQYHMMLEAARARVKNLFGPEIKLGEHRQQVQVTTGLWFGVDPADHDALAQWRARLRPLQSEMADLDVPMGPDAPPRMIILEAPMGEGKTEAAEILINRLIQSQSATGAVFALPTEASTSRLRDRMGQYSSDVFAVSGLVVSSHEAALQASGQASWLRRQSGAQPNFDDAEKSGDLSRRAAYRFFTQHSRRSFLAPFTVCTVDQVEMAVMPTRHAQVRAFGLSGRVLVIDEAHAYDAYMRHILVEAIRMTARMGGWTVVLSATLPAHIRQQLLTAYALPDDGIAGAASQAYPLLSHVALGQSLSQTQQKALPPSDRQAASVAWMCTEGQAQAAGTWAERFPHTWAKIVATVTGPNRGCAAIVCNTVKRAQQVYEMVKAWANMQPANNHVAVSLLHSRFRRQERQAKEQELLAWAGTASVDTPEVRAGRIIVATQVIEQSLDLDFDIMASDLAPIDLMLQRRGRLHRHARQGRPESAMVARFCVVIEQPAADLMKLLPTRAIENLLAQPNGSLHAQVIPYIQELNSGRGQTSDWDTQVMTKTLAWINEKKEQDFVIPSLRSAVDAVYVAPTVSERQDHRQAYAHRITMTPPKGLTAWEKTGVNEPPSHQAETRQSETDTLPTLILVKTKDGQKWTLPLWPSKFQGVALTRRLSEGFEDFLVSSGQGKDALNLALIDDAQSWVVPLPIAKALLPILDKNYGLDPFIFETLTGQKLTKENRYLLPFQVISGKWTKEGESVILGSHDGPLSRSRVELSYSATHGLTMTTTS
jgi:hypothetical protein